MSSSRKPPGSAGRGKATAPKSGGAKPKTGSTSKAVVPRTSGAVAKTGGAGRGRGQPQSMIVPEGYHAREVKPAKNYDVISFARAMNDDFGPRVQKLFDTETQAAIDAQHTGIYIGWRLPGQIFDCQRVGTGSKCFCGHLLSEHAKFTGKSVNVPCKSCKCKAYKWIPSKPEEIGEFWFQRRRNFDVTTWRAKCRCKHAHDEHDPTAYKKCKKCSCGSFDSVFCCAACDKHWEDHDTFFETAADRKQAGLPVGEEYLPFAEIPSLKNMALTGVDDEDMSYMRVQGAPYDPDMKMSDFKRLMAERGMTGEERRALPPSGAPTDNSSPFPGPGGSGSKGGFRPVYD